jgi:RHS repeat-associated protein
MWRDDETGTDHTLHRHYANNLARWLSPDPAGRKAAKLTDPQTWNMYVYVRNNPTNLTDPTGLEVALSGGKADQEEEKKRLIANVSKKGEAALFKTVTTPNGNTTLAVDKDKVAGFQGKHSAGYRWLVAAIEAKRTITVQLVETESKTGPRDAQGNVTVSLKRGVDPLDKYAPLRGVDGQVIPNPFHIIAGHEVLGHALPRILGLGTDQDTAVRVENELRQEQGIPLRGSE